MTTSLTKLLTDTLALDEKATKGPWVPDWGRVRDDNCGTVCVLPKGVEFTDVVWSGNKDLIAAFRSSAPKLARIAKIAVEALEALREHGQKMEFDDGDIDQSDFCANALAAIEREAGK